MNYYCLIAGFPDIHLDDSKDVPSMNSLKNELEEQLSAEDAKSLRLIYAKYDNANLLQYLRNKDAELNLLGNLTADDWKQLTDMMQEVEQPKDARLQPYVQRYYSAYSDESFSFEGTSHEDYLSGLYYEYAMQNNNKFLHDWFEFSLNINNILTAIACRKHNLDQRIFILGNNEIAQLLRKGGNARDFGLTGIFDGLDTLMNIAETTNLLERERQIDALKWAWLDENTFFNYFTVEKVLAFVLKCELINRWKPLTQEQGTQVFRNLLTDLKKDVRLED